MPEEILLIDDANDAEGAAALEALKHSTATHNTT